MNGNISRLGLVVDGADPCIIETRHGLVQLCSPVVFMVGLLLDMTDWFDGDEDLCGEDGRSHGVGRFLWTGASRQLFPMIGRCVRP